MNKLELIDKLHDLKYHLGMDPFSRETIDSVIELLIKSIIIDKDKLEEFIKARLLVEPVSRSNYLPETNKTEFKFIAEAKTIIRDDDICAAGFEETENHIARAFAYDLTHKLETLE